MKTYSIALIPGDGIGKDVTEATWQVLKARRQPWRFRHRGHKLPMVVRPLPGDGCDDAARRHRDPAEIRCDPSRRGGVAGGSARTRYRFTACSCRFGNGSYSMPTSDLTGSCRVFRDRCARRVSTSCASARTPRANIPAPEGAFTPARPTRLRSRRRSSRVRASSGSSVSA